MPFVKVELDQQAYETLVAIALREWRPIPWQAEWLLRGALSEEGGSKQAAPPSKPTRQPWPNDVHVE